MEKHLKSIIGNVEAISLSISATSYATLYAEISDGERERRKEERCLRREAIKQAK